MPRPEGQSARKRADEKKARAKKVAPPQVHTPKGPPSTTGSKPAGKGMPRPSDAKADASSVNEVEPGRDCAPGAPIPAGAPPGNGDLLPLRRIALDLIDPHPLNPRLGFHEPTVSAQAVQMQARGEFDPAHAITVRPKPEGRYETIHGHQRTESARRAALAWVWAHLVELSDSEAYLALAAGNMQEPLTHLEVALHSLEVVNPAQGKQGKGLAEYARRIGMAAPNLSRYRRGAEVFSAVRQELASDEFIRGCRDKAEHLAIVHDAADAHWGALVRWVVERGATIADTRDHVNDYLPVETDDAAPEPNPPGGTPPSVVPPNSDESPPETTPPVPTAAEASEGVAPPPPPQNPESLAAESVMPTGADRPVGVTSTEMHQHGNAADVFQAHWTAFRATRAAFTNVSAGVLRRVISSWEGCLATAFRAPTRAIEHLAEQDRLAERLSALAARCAELRTTAPRRYHGRVDTLQRTVTRIRDSGRDLRAAQIADLQSRVARLQESLVNTTTPIEALVGLAGRGRRE